MSLSYTQHTRGLQMEISTKCNALCPSCIRTDFSTFQNKKKFIPSNEELPREVIHEILSSKWAKVLREIEFCGTLDEPLMHSQFLGVLQDIRRFRKKIKISIHTNGGVRDPVYFKKLARELKAHHPQSVVRFSIDGLGETNSIYRYGVSWAKVEENLHAFIEAGGQAIWQMLIFPWNKHQVEKVRTLAKKMGCHGFYLRPDRSQISNFSVQQIKERRHSNQTPQTNLGCDIGEMEKIDQLISEPVDCIYKNQRRMIFVSWDGRVWPCCFWTNIRYEDDLKKQRLDKTVFSRYSEHFNSLYHFPFDTIIKHRFFSKDLVKSWQDNSELKWRCSEKCSIKKKRASDLKSDDKRHLEQTIF